MKNLLLVLSVLTLFTLSCKKNAGTENNSTNAPIVGLGETPGELQGEPFSLPAGVELVGEITGEVLAPIAAELGCGYYVDVFFKLKNAGNRAAVTFPAGLVLKSLSAADQSGVALQNETMFIEAGTIVVVKLNLYCGNMHRNPSGDNSRFVFGPINNAAGLKELIKLLTNKDICKEVDGYNSVTVVQHALWDLTDGDGLSASTKSDIQNIPNK